ncbi:MAG: hypothetical protein DRJ96_02560 [Thermoprotei archaeon]|mgnify:FL=1|nr:type II toxin-antitoxin system CcdA family antitoxin [Thermoproteales archaeon]RLE85058.1 MAG: hypothetical protein DRJ67_09500 [Thermoprotei archaeon]RLE97910.1 MAG: hypothetical protein DRJ96_02560 [Thermoprotei archaeon]RLE99963.1 MAG: hypothetical protein DRJ57_01645 [Thermoprotei archaeon]
MKRYVTVSAKVPVELKEEAERLGIRISAFLRKALEEEVRRRKLQELERRVEELRGVLDKVDVDEFVQLIRADRESR